MDHPNEKIVGTIQLEKIQRLMKGYLASLEEKSGKERRGGKVSAMCASEYSF